MIPGTSDFTMRSISNAAVLPFALMSCTRHLCITVVHVKAPTPEIAVVDPLESRFRGPEPIKVNSSMAPGSTLVHKLNRQPIVANELPVVSYHEVAPGKPRALTEEYAPTVDVVCVSSRQAGSRQASSQAIRAPRLS
jgi:hypothetical protein